MRGWRAHSCSRLRKCVTEPVKKSRETVDARKRKSTMSELGNRTGALLPTTPILEQAWDHTTMNGRRLLPSPGPKKVSNLIHIVQTCCVKCRLNYFISI